MCPMPSFHVSCENGIAGLMIRKNPRGDLPVVHDSAFVDPTAILCGRVVVHESVFIGPYAVIRADEMDTNGHMKAIVIGRHADLATMPKVTVDASEFSEDVARTNNSLVQGYKRLEGEI